LKEQASKQTNKQASKQASKQINHTMMSGAFVLKMKTREWRLCVVKQVPADSLSCWMMFGQNRMDRTTFQIEFQPHQETTLINHITNMADDTETDVRLGLDLVLVLVLVSDPPAVSCIESLWSLKGHEMYRKQIRTASALVNSLHQDIHMLRISPQTKSPQTKSPQTKSPSQQQTKSRHPMQTRSKALL
jgi:hypothetical protein